MQLHDVTFDPFLILLHLEPMCVMFEHPTTTRLSGLWVTAKSFLHTEHGRPFVDTLALSLLAVRVGLLFSSVLAAVAGSWSLHFHLQNFFHLPIPLHTFWIWLTLSHPAAEHWKGLLPLFSWVPQASHICLVAELVGPGLSSMSPAKISRTLSLTGVPKNTHHLSIDVLFG